MDVIGYNIPIQIILQKFDEEWKFILEPKQIYKTSTKQLQTHVIAMYLIKRKNLRVKDSTWEDDSFI